MTRFVAALAACLLLFCPTLVLAQPQNQPMVKPPTGPAVEYPADAAGVPKAAEAYPREYQSTNQVLFNSTVVITPAGTVNIAPQVFSDASLYGRLWVRVRVAVHTIGAAGVNGPLIVQPRGSVDGVTYSPIALAAFTADSVKMDTLQYEFWENSRSPASQTGNTAHANGVWVPLVDAKGHQLPFPFLQFGIINRGAATDSVSIEVMGRQF